MKNKVFNVWFLNDLQEWQPWMPTTKRSGQRFNHPRVYTTREAAVTASNVLLLGDEEFEPVNAVWIREVKEI